MGVVILCGLLVLSTGLAVASTDAYFGTVHGAFKRACSEHALLQTVIDADAFSEACVFVARVLKNLSPTSLPTEEQITEAALDAFRVPRDCGECVQVVHDLEIALSAQVGGPPSPLPKPPQSRKLRKRWRPGVTCGSPLPQRRHSAGISSPPPMCRAW
jgi:hypothetical protein